MKPVCLDSPDTQQVGTEGVEERRELGGRGGGKLKRGLLCPKRLKETALKAKQTFHRINRIKMLTIQTSDSGGGLH